MHYGNSAKKKKKTAIYLTLIVSRIIGIVGLGVVIFKNTSNQNSPVLLPSEEQDNCPYNEKSLASFSKHIYEQANEEDLAQWKKIPRDYVIKLWKKGYHWFDIIQLWGWQIPEAEIPDLTTQERIGVLNGLIIMSNPRLNDPDITAEEALKINETNYWVGRVKDLIVIVRKIPIGKTKINIDKRFSDGTGEDERGDRGQTRKIVNFALWQENIDPQRCEVSILWAIGVQRFGNEWDVNCGYSRGSSGGSAIYLALLSTLHQKPISRQVATTGTLIMSDKRGMINGREILLASGANLPITGLKEKVAACTEKGINQLVLSKYHTAPLLSSWDEYQKKWIKNEEDYQKEVPPEIRAKIKVHWTENISELKELILEDKLS